MPVSVCFQVRARSTLNIRTTTNIRWYHKEELNYFMSLDNKLRSVSLMMDDEADCG